MDKTSLIYDFVSWVNEAWEQGESDIAVMKDRRPSPMGDTALSPISRLDTLDLVEQFLQHLRETE